MSGRIVIAGGGILGYEVARRLEKLEVAADVTVVSPNSMMVYQPLLPELAAGVIEPRHAVVPLRSGLERTEVLAGELVGLDRDARRARVHLRDGRHDELPFDHLVVALGSITNVLPVPGLAARAIGFQTVAEALHLRDRVLERMQLAEVTNDPDVRRRALTFVFVGGGYSGVEALGELESMAADACAAFPGLQPADLRWVLVEATDQILPMVRRPLRVHVLEELRARGVDVRLGTLVEAVEGRTVRLSDDTTVDADTLVWCAGVRPHPTVSDLGLALDGDGRLSVDPRLRVEGTADVWSGGDCARVPDLVEGGTCPPSAQYATRQARTMATNIVRALRGEEPEEFRYRPKGELITFGRHRAVGEIYGVPLRGRSAWLLRHAYHVGRIPTASRKARLWVDWAVNLAFPREITELGSAREPRAPFEEAVEARDEDLARSRP